MGKRLIMCFCFYNNWYLQTLLFVKVTIIKYKYSIQSFILLYSHGKKTVFKNPLFQPGGK